MSHDAASATALLAVRFRYDRGDGEVIDRYTNAARSIVHATLGTFTPDPSLTLQTLLLRGNTEDDEVRLQMRYRHPSREPMATLANGAPHAPITVEIYDFLDDDPDTTHTLLYQGTLSELRIDRRGVAEIKIGGVRSQLADGPLGLAATTYCPWRFGDSICGIDLSALEETGNVDSVDGTEVTLTGLSTTTAGYWHRGYLTRGGLSILIREHLADQVVKLQRPPPADWLGEDVVATPGCTKSIGACRAWNNEARFGGCGIAMPSANPLVSGI